MTDYDAHKTPKICACSNSDDKVCLFHALEEIYVEHDKLKRYGQGVWVLILFLLFAPAAHAFTTQASYYTVKSAKSEGTSGDFTASGARFRENQLTCASWDYKFGTVLKISNPKNGASILARVTDRGPSKKLYRRGRKIDLTSKGFNKLGIPLRQGVATVIVVKR